MITRVAPVLFVACIAAGIWQLQLGNRDLGFTILWWGIAAVSVLTYAPVILVARRPPPAEAEAAWRELSLKTPPTPLDDVLRREAAPAVQGFAGIGLAMLAAAFAGWWMTVHDDASLAPALLAVVVMIGGAVLTFRGFSGLSGGAAEFPLFEEVGLSPELPMRRNALRATGTRHGRSVQTLIEPGVMRVTIECSQQPPELPEGGRWEDGALIVERHGRPEPGGILPVLLAAERACT